VIVRVTEFSSSGTSHATITGNTVLDTGDDGIYVSNSDHVTISNNQIQTVVDDGIDVNGDVGGSSTNYTIANNTIT
jgi:parallel beta-helix repeat protein